MKKGSLLLFAAVIFGAFLFGCASQTEQLIKQGYPPAYARGYEDGCHSGKNAVGSFFDKFQKDVKLYETNKEYREGWHDGFQQCKSKQEALERQNRESIEQQRLIEEKRHDKKMEQQIGNDAFKGIDTQKLQRDLEKKYHN